MHVSPHGFPVVQTRQQVGGGGVDVVMPVATHCVLAVTPDGARIVAVSVFAPGNGPILQLPTLASPFASVVCTAPVIVPPPPVTANVTGTPATGRPAPSRTSAVGTVGTSAPTRTVCPPPKRAVIVKVVGTTVTVADPLTPATAAEIVAVPADRPVTTPFSTVARVVSEELQTAPGSAVVVPRASLQEALSRIDAPTSTLAVGG